MIKPENRNCFEFFRDCTKDFGIYDVSESFGNLISRKKFMKDVEAIAGFLDSKNIKRGDVVTIFLPNTVQSFAAFYAANRIGVIANIVHPLTPPDVLAEILKTTHSKAVFILDVLMEKYVSMLRKRNKLVIVCSPADYATTLMRPALKVYSKIKSKETPSSNTASYHTICHLNKIAPKVENNGDDIAVYLHGGGTTGKSKTIQLTSKNLNELAYKLSFFDAPHAPGAECSLAVLPLFHAFGLGVVMHFSMCQLGDLLFWGTKSGRVTHVGIYLQDGEYIHCSGQVKLNSLDKKSPKWLSTPFLSISRINGMIGTKGITTVKEHPWYF